MATNMEIKFTDRELQVLDLLSQGLSDNQIGAKLGITRTTVATHNMHIYYKLSEYLTDGCKSRVVAARWYFENILFKKEG